MPTNISAPLDNNLIKVGYIDPKFGFIDGVTICDANSYAEKNPGTIFIFRENRQKIRFLNINQVNKLGTENIVTDNSSCAGIQTYKECGPPAIQFAGGGGIAAAGNPIVSTDGSILGVDLISGGYGYEYAPKVSAKDDCNYGNGAVLTAILGNIVESYEVYTDEEDLELYELCEDTFVGYGTKWGPNGEDLGPWEPSKYTKPDEDPIRREIENYQRLLLSENNPLFTTRKNKVLSISSSLGRTFADKVDVTCPIKNPQGQSVWGSFMETYAISPVPPSNVQGSDFPNEIFTFEYEVKFPLDGEYTFKGMCDNKAQLYVDDFKISDLTGFGNAVTPIQKTFKAGNHTVRIDLVNLPITEKINSALTSEYVEVDFSAFGQGRIRNLSFTFTSEDGSDSFVINGVDKNRQTRIDRIKVKPKVNYKVVASSDASKHKSVEQGLIKNGTKAKEAGVGTSNKIFADYLSTSNDNDDIQITAGKGSFTSSNKRKVGGRNTYDLTYSLNETQNAQPISSNSITKKVFNTIDYIDKADRPLWRTNVNNRGGFINEYGVSPFDTTSQLEDNPYAGTHRIIWNNINFPVDGNYIIEIEVDDNVNLTFAGSGTETVINKRGFTGVDQSTGKSTETKFFKAGNYTITADLEQIPGGKFGFSGIPGTNPMALAINVQTSFAEIEVISSKSWNENPMGVALVIDSPMPTIPQEQKPIQDGPCPPSPIWTTRFPGSRDRWYPVIYTKNGSWSKFMNRYALSPVLPLDTPGSDSAGINYRTSWDLDIPYPGFYGVKGTADNKGKVYIDGEEVKILEGFNEQNPSITKKFLSKGRHVIEVEVFNQPIIKTSLINQKIFSTEDWIAPSNSQPQNVDVQFNAFVGGDFANTFTIDELGINVSKNRGNKGNSQSFTKTVETGKVYSVKLYSTPGTIKLRTQGDNILQAEDSNDFNWKDIGCSVDKGRFFDLNGSECKFVVDSTSTQSDTTISNNGVSYSGPNLFHHIQTTGGTTGAGWGSFMNQYSISPKVFDNISTPDSRINGLFTLLWKGVNFPETGSYKIKFQADNIGTLKIDNQIIQTTTEFYAEPGTIIADVTQGNHDILVELTNIQDRTNIFANNPTGVALLIEREVSISTQTSQSWAGGNPMAVSAVLIPPPCPRKISGKGRVVDVIVEDPGNGYLPPNPVGQNYPVSLAIKEIVVTNSGLGYNCGVDQIIVTPNNGVRLDYTCDSFGRIKDVKVLNGGIGFTEYPTITMPSDNGINVEFIPVFEVIRDPLISDPNKLIQVTDLVGIKRTGYVDGRAYYGAVFYKEGIKYAGYYETAGTLVQIYDTLQESITAKVTTQPSAIPRSGTDVSSNNPSLNIPGTPNTISDT